MSKKIASTVVIICAVVCGLLVGLNDNSYLKKESMSSNIQVSKGKENNISPDENESTATLSGDSSGDVTTTPSVPTEPVKPEKEIPENIKSIYCTGWVIGTKNIRDSVITALKENGFNAIVIDIKDEAGQLSYDSTVQTAIDTKASRKMVSNIKEVISELKSEGFYVIGRIVTFKDPNYASKDSSIAYKKSDGSVWKDYNGNSWPNPYNKNSWEYPIALAKEGAELGFDEIQFDYIRFPSSEGKTSAIEYGYERETKSKADMIAEFLNKVMEEMKPYDVVISADVFGITTKRDGDFENIGQDFSRIATIVDVICPMVYPSHYNFNEYKIAKPDKNPYQIVYNSMADAFNRFDSYKELHSGEQAEIRFAKLRPYIQDFTASWLGSGNYLTYGDKEVTDQVQALYDLDMHDFCLWDPSNKYCYSAINNIKPKNVEENP